MTRVPFSPAQVRVILIGIAGPSGCGKTTYARHLSTRLHSPLCPIGLDDFFVRVIPIEHPVLGRIKSEEEPETLDDQRLLTILRQIKADPRLTTRYHQPSVSIDERSPIFIVVEGFLLFALSKEVTQMFDIRLFFDATQDQCRMRRYRRRLKISGNVPDEDVRMAPEYRAWFDHLVWAAYLKWRDVQLAQAERKFTSNDYGNYQYDALDSYIDKRLKEISLSPQT